MRISDGSSDVCSSDLSSRWCRLRCTPYALAAARRGHGQEMGGAVIAQQLAGSEGSTNQEIALVARKGAHVIDSTEGGRAEQRVAATLETIFPDQHEERSEEHTSELQSLMRISYAVFCLKKKIIIKEM